MAGFTGACPRVSVMATGGCIVLTEAGQALIKGDLGAQAAVKGGEGPRVRGAFGGGSAATSGQITLSNAARRRRRRQRWQRLVSPGFGVGAPWNEK